ncbi:histidinol dehydrogenase [Lactobacillaceae bacterium Scapto_B20]
MKIISESLASILAQVDRKTLQATNRPEVEATVAEIIKNIAANGDVALREYEQRFDNVDLTDFRIPAATIDEAFDAADPKLIAALQTAKDNITSYHQNEIERGFVDANQKGVVRGQKLTPLEKVGLYVPGGTAAYPSSILMSVIPAKLAGVKQIVMVTPPQANGVSQAALVAAKLAGVNEIYQIGGAQAIAALAVGTESIPKVDKIMGPGNIFVATAKKQVFGLVDIDMIAGPSEIGIIADDNAKAFQVAADLLSQAEHDKLARPILVTDSLQLAEAVNEELAKQLAILPRQEIAQAAVDDQGFIAVVDSIDDAFVVMNQIAPEHLEVQIPNAEQYLSQIQNAGSVFLGFNASEPVGDYIAGPNHILPTGGTARFFSPLGVYDFVKRTQFVSYSNEALANIADAVGILARVEGLEAHARGVESRLVNSTEELEARLNANSNRQTTNR